MERAAGAVAAPSKASDILASLAASKGRKGKKGAAAVEASGADEAVAAVAAEAAAPRAADAGAPDVETVTVGTPFAQGREKCKAWFESHPAAMEAVAGLIAGALKHGVAPLAAPESTAAVSEIAAGLPGAVSDEEEELMAPGKL